MNYGELKTQFEGLLKRRDMTPAQRDIFIQNAIMRVQRVLRIPAMEKHVKVTYDGTIFNTGELPVPADYLRLHSITVNDEHIVHQGDAEQVLSLAKVTGTPSLYYRRGSRFKFGPTPPAGTEFRLAYYVEFDALAADDTANFLTVSAPDLTLYAALSYAGDWFIDKRAAAWEGRYRDILSEIQDQADQDELINATVSAAYQFPED